jgi:hypothetical protein
MRRQPARDRYDLAAPGEVGAVIAGDMEWIFDVRDHAASCRADTRYPGVDAAGWSGKAPGHPAVLH